MRVFVINQIQSQLAAGRLSRLLSGFPMLTYKNTVPVIDLIKSLTTFDH